MNVSMIIGSPKTGNSCSATLLKQLETDLTGKAQGNAKNAFPVTTTTYQIRRNPLSLSDVETVVASDVLVIAFPLYVDGVPSHVLRCLYQLEEAFHNSTSSKKPTCYVIINCGFCEGKQNINAVGIMQNFCKRSGIPFGQAFTAGGGEAIRSMIEANNPFGKGGLTYINTDWNQFVDHILATEHAASCYCTPAYPSFIFRIIGNHFFWDQLAKKNGISKKQMKARRSYTKRP